MAARRRQRTGRRVGGWVLVAVTVPVGAISAGTALLATAALTGHRLVAAAVAVAAAAAVGCLPARAGATRVADTPLRQRLTVIGAIGLSVLVTVVLGGGLIYDDAPRPTRPDPTGARFWDLPDGSRIAYWRTPPVGQPHPTPVVLVHGGPGAPDGSTGPIAAALAGSGFDVYRYHQFGSGLSSRPADIGEYTVHRHVSDIEAIRVALGAERLVLVGGSWGGQLIANYLAAHPDRVDRAVLSSPAPIWAPAYSDDTRLTRAGRDDQRAVIAEHPRFAVAHVLLNAVGPGTAHALLPDDPMDGVFEAVVAGFDMRPGCPAGGAGDHREHPAGLGFWANAMTVRDSRRTPDPRPALRETRTPVLILRGECDYQSWEVAREYRDVLPGAVLLPVDGAGHSIQTDRPDVHLAAVSAFLLDRPLPGQPHTSPEPPW
ncbi:alpha/beta fold hydrolase [Pseudonocardia lacus]|uniref:alpha/beta fold hydrolase n=1 Tax=Pseudonocardia lacus TaxID=2835865 RepID=UPI001BDD90D4|nr:alpha/beta hydrolase [Pseudonocardia lacus]